MGHQRRALDEALHPAQAFGQGEQLQRLHETARHTGVADDTGLPATWSQDGENLIWRVDFAGRSTAAVFDGRACAIGRDGEGVLRQEVVVCWSAEDGTRLWERRFTPHNTFVPWQRLGWAAAAGSRPVERSPHAPAATVAATERTTRARGTRPVAARAEGSMVMVSGTPVGGPRDVPRTGPVPPRGARCTASGPHGACESLQSSHIRARSGRSGRSRSIQHL